MKLRYSSDVKKRAIGTHLHVVRYLHTTFRDDGCKSYVFYTYITHNYKFHKVMIDDGSYMNIISKWLLRR